MAQAWSSRVPGNFSQLLRMLMLITVRPSQQQPFLFIWAFCCCLLVYVVLFVLFKKSVMYPKLT